METPFDVFMDSSIHFQTGALLSTVNEYSKALAQLYSVSSYPKKGSLRITNIFHNPNKEHNKVKRSLHLVFHAQLLLTKYHACNFKRSGYTH